MHRHPRLRQTLLLHFERRFRRRTCVVARPRLRFLRRGRFRFVGRRFVRVGAGAARVLRLRDSRRFVRKERIEQSVERLDFFRAAAEHGPQRRADARSFAQTERVERTQRIVRLAGHDPEVVFAAQSDGKRNDAAGEILAHPMLARTVPKP